MEDGVIDEVLGQVRSGKEADVFLVQVGEEVRCAKVYKDSSHRSFKQAAAYQEGRRVQNSRSARALNKRSAFGQKEAESNWITAEVQALNTLSAAGVRVPKPYGFFDGVLVMELIVDEAGAVAPRLDDVQLSTEIAIAYHAEMIHQIVLMLCAGIIHGDLSEFNVLVDSRGPVIIDLPQAVNAAGNNNAQTMFERDVNNMARYFGKFAPQILTSQYAKEIWALYQNGLLTPEVELTGTFEETASLLDLDGVMEAILDAQREHEEKLSRRVDAPQAVGVEQAAEQWTAKEERSRKGKNRPPEANRGGDRNRQTSPDSPRAGDGFRQGAPNSDNRNRALPPVQKPSSIAPKPMPAAPPPPAPEPPKMQWGRRPGR